MIRTIIAAITLLFAFPSAAQTIPATCATIKAVLASASGGEVISLNGNCPTITITKAYTKQVTINAGGSSVAGLVITGKNVRWRSGMITAPGGAFASGPLGYGIRVYNGAANIRFDGVTITAAKKGVVLDSVSGITFADSKFVLLGEDGIIASRVTGMTVARSRFAQTIGKPSECNVGGVVTLDVPSRDCIALGGVWRDGFHADAVQMRNGVVNARIYDSIVEGATQGITQMDTTGDAPLERVAIERNIVRTDNYHHITLGANCIGCRVMNNRVERAAGSLIKAVIRQGAATRCGNYAQDERVQDGACT